LVVIGVVIGIVVVGVFNPIVERHSALLVVGVRVSGQEDVANTSSQLVFLLDELSFVSGSVARRGVSGAARLLGRAAEVDRPTVEGADLERVRHCCRSTTCRKTHLTVFESIRDLVKRLIVTLILVTLFVIVVFLVLDQVGWGGLSQVLLHALLTVLIGVSVQEINGDSRPNSIVRVLALGLGKLGLGQPAFACLAMHFFMVGVCRACAPVTLDVAHPAAIIQAQCSGRELVARIEHL
jgi:hypothetical protein